MDQADYSDAALVLLGHGSTLDDDSGAAVFHQAGELRRRKQFAEVREAFWKQAPQVREVLSSLTAAQVFIVPMFISEGHFSEAIIPRELGFGSAEETMGGPKYEVRSPKSEGTGTVVEFRTSDFGLRSALRVQVRGGQKLIYCRPIGSHEDLAAVLLARARDVVEKFPFPRPPQAKDTTLFIAGHGTEQNENSRKAIEMHAALIQRMDLYADVQAVFMEEAPRIAECYALARTRNVIVVPFFISDGMHVKADIPVLLGEARRLVEQRLEAGKPAWRNPTERQGKLVWCSQSVGGAPQIAEVILARVGEAASW